jgi:2',3'-cyclic-nucleotide 2'-phosphodiesterase
LRILFIGDVVGAAGMTAVKSMLPNAISRWGVDLAVVNGENSAGAGFGITEDAYRGIRAAGADVVTLGNHSWARKEALSFIETEPRLVRPLNYVPGTPGQGFVRVETAGGKRVLVLNALGRLFMEPADDPFGAINRLLQAHTLGRDFDAILVDFHCEATGEKQAMGHFCDGRVSVVVGTHTHTPSADHRVLGGGTAYITDAGMTGDYDSVVGMQKEEPVRRFATGMTSGRFLPAEGAAAMCGVAVETDSATGLATRIAPVRLGGQIEQRTPGFWE